MYKIRKNVFETNSSSMHTLSFKKKTKLQDSYMYVDDFDNKIHCKLGDFGWGYDRYSDQQTKLEYLLTMIWEGCHEIENDFYDSSDFKTVEKVVRDYCHCDGIVVDDFDGYIDHQSMDTIDGFLSEYDMTIKRFIFSEDVLLIIDNDNH